MSAARKRSPCRSRLQEAPDRTPDTQEAYTGKRPAHPLCNLAGSCASSFSDYNATPNDQQLEKGLVAGSTTFFLAPSTLARLRLFCIKPQTATTQPELSPRERNTWPSSANRALLTTEGLCRRRLHCLYGSQRNQTKQRDHSGQCRP